MSDAPQNPLLPFLLRYGPAAGEEGPVRFAEEVLGHVLDEWQKDALRAFARGARRISIKACHGPGKTFVVSLMVVYQMVFRFPQHVAATAPSVGQLEGALVKEVKLRFEELPAVLRERFEIKKTEIELKGSPQKSWFKATTARAEKPEALQGIHCEGGYVLLVADEASGVDEKIFESAAGSMSGENCTTVLLSNPVRSSGFFWQTFNDLRDMWHTITVSAFDSTRVTEDFVEDIRRRYGEKSNAYRVRVLGEFPLADNDTVIPFEMVEGARTRDIVLPPNMERIWGLDVARFGDDRNVLAERTKLSGTVLDSWDGIDLMQTTARVVNRYKSLPPHERPTLILVDEIGLGAGVVDRLRELGLPVRGVNVSESPAFKQRYTNLRAELWFAAREWLAGMNKKLSSCPGGCARAGHDPRTCPFELLASELVAVRFEYADSGGKVKVESKKEMKKRLRKSPDYADAFVLTFADEPSTLIHGSSNNSGWRSNWNQPIRRNVPIV